MNYYTFHFCGKIIGRTPRNSKIQEASRGGWADLGWLQKNGIYSLRKSRELYHINIEKQNELYDIMIISWGLSSCPFVSLSLESNNYSMFDVIEK